MASCCHFYATGKKSSDANLVDDALCDVYVKKCDLN